MRKNKYQRQFYESLLSASDNTKYVAQKVYGILEDICPIESAVDIGCGVGTWLRVFNENDDKEILGVDGNWVFEEQLLIPKENFIRKDLNDSIKINKRFALAQSLEVAEHLNPSRAESLVEDLTQLSDLVLFSAAIPYQGGVGHINEQWPSFWIGLFEKQDYDVFDIIRPELWNDDRIRELHYKQNIFCFAKRGTLVHKKMMERISGNNKHIYDMVLPEIYLINCAYYESRSYKLIQRIRGIFGR